jgi:translocation and assembly module TamA
LTLGALSDHPDAFDRDAVTAGAALQRRVSARFSASGGLAYEHSRVAQDGPARDYRLLSLPLTLDYDGSDNLLDPRGGLRLAAQLSPTRVLEGDAQGFVLGRLTASAYLSLDGYPALGTESAPTVLAGRLVVGSIFGAAPDAVPPDWRFYAGGAGSVRGYTYQSIGPRTPSNQPAGGDGLLEGSLELRRHVRANWAMVAFADAGAVSENGIPGAGSLAVGLGLGVRYLTPVGPVRVDLATPLDRDIEDSPVQLYIGIGQAF